MANREKGWRRSLRHLLDGEPEEGAWGDPTEPAYAGGESGAQTVPAAGGMGADAEADREAVVARLVSRITLATRPRTGL